MDPSRPNAEPSPTLILALTNYFVITVLSGHALVAIIGMFDGRSLFDRGLDADSLFRDHWLADLNGMKINSIAVVTAVVGLSVLAAMHRGLGGRWRPLLTGCGWLMAILFTLILPKNLSLYVVPFLLPLALFRAGWPEFSIILLAAAGLVLGLITLRHHRMTGTGCPACGRTNRARVSQQMSVRLAKLAAYGAALAPMGYAVVRLMWAAGIPVGTTSEFLRRINEANPGHARLSWRLPSPVWQSAEHSSAGD